MVGCFVKNISLRSNAGRNRHYRLFPDRIDRWIGNLCEPLFEVVRQVAGVSAQNRQGRINAHTEGWLGALTRHLGYTDLNFFARHAGGDLPSKQFIRRKNEVA